jgi:hypothetical protein
MEHFGAEKVLQRAESSQLMPIAGHGVYRLLKFRR